MRLAALVSLLAPPLCWGCGAIARAGQPLCGTCRARLRWLGAEPVALAGLMAWAPVAYEGAARELVRALKYRGAQRLAATMAGQIHANAPPGWLAGTLVPVPLHAARRRRRGYNQAELLGSALARRAGIPLSACLEREAGAPQVGRPREQRAHVAGLHASSPAPALALLVDDVVTTGGTLAACAAALRAAGSVQVAAVAYARTLAR
jgi:ComF family protein